MNAVPGAPLDRVFHAISDPTRRSVLARLSGGEQALGVLAAPHDMSLPAFSKHIRVLEQAGLVHTVKRGRTHYCSLNAEPMKAASEWLAYYRKFWESRLDSLDTFLKENP